MADEEIPWEGITRSIRSFLVRRKREGVGLTDEEVAELIMIIDAETGDGAGSGG